MSYNPYFYNNFRGNISTFQPYVSSPYVPPPPPPPAFFFPRNTPETNQELSDQAFLNTYETKMTVGKLKQINIKHLSITKVREEIREMVLTLNELKTEEKFLTENLSTLSDEEWNDNMQRIEEKKLKINETMSHINGPYLDILRKLLAKRSAKRLRMKRVSLEKKREKEDWIKELKERSRKIDENLQKIQDDINKAKQEEKAKLEADFVLKEILRKKSDAKKCITKLDAFVKLRRARQNTARGRGETVSESESEAFYANIEKLKLLWAQKLQLYEKEESELRAQLEEDSEQLNLLKTETEKHVASNLDQWKKALFGGQLPQADFEGDVAKFLAVRSQWDKYINKGGTSIPIGWVPPSDDKTA